MLKFLIGAWAGAFVGVAGLLFIQGIRRPDEAEPKIEHKKIVHDCASSPIELDTCPLCGGEAKVHDYPAGMTGQREWQIQCSLCHFGRSGFPSLKDAVIAWNGRAR